MYRYAQSVTIDYNHEPRVGNRKKTETLTEDRKHKTQVRQDPAEDGEPRDSWTLVSQWPKSTNLHHVLLTMQVVCWWEQLGQGSQNSHQLEDSCARDPGVVILQPQLRTASDPWDMGDLTTWNHHLCYTLVSSFDSLLDISLYIQPCV